MKFKTNTFKALSDSPNVYLGKNPALLDAVIDDDDDANNNINNDNDGLGRKGMYQTKILTTPVRVSRRIETKQLSSGKSKKFLNNEDVQSLSSMFDELCVGGDHKKHKSDEKKQLKFPIISKNNNKKKKTAEGASSIIKSEYNTYDADDSEEEKTSSKKDDTSSSLYKASLRRIQVNKLYDYDTPRRSARIAEKKKLSTEKDFGSTI